MSDDQVAGKQAAVSVVEIQVGGGCAHHGSLGLKAAGVGLPVGPDHAIDAELGVIREAPKITPIRPVLYRLA